MQIHSCNNITFIDFLSQLFSLLKQNRWLYLILNDIICKKGYITMFEGFFHGHLGDDRQANYDALKYFAITTLIGIVHATFAVVFFSMPVIPMGIYNVIVVVLYFLFSRNLSNLNYYTKILFIYCTEIILHCVLATIMVGWNYGFMYYLIGLIPVSFYMTFSIAAFKRRLIYPISITIAVCVAYFTMRTITYIFDPIYTNNHVGFEIFFFILNSIIAFGCTLLFSILFAVEVN